MELDLLRPAVLALIVIVIVLVLEEWAYFRAKSKVQRAVITGIAVFVLVVIFNLFPSASF